MELLKNFFVGLFFLILFIVFGFILMITWPIIIGLSSFILAILAGLFFIALIFAFIVIIGKVVRDALFKNNG